MSLCPLMYGEKCMNFRNRILKTDKQIEYLNVLRQTIDSNNNIFAWGTGRGAKKLLSFMNKIGWNGNLTFIDSNEDKCGTQYEGCVIISPFVFFNEIYSADALLLITCADTEGVHNTINSLGGHNKTIDCDLTSIDLEANETWYDYIWNHIADFETAYELLSDEKSKDIMVGLLNYRISRDVSYIRQYVDSLEYQYFEKEFIDLRSKIIVDCGAYTGDTVENIIKITNGNIKKIYSFEPDYNIYTRLIRNIKSKRWDNVKAYNLGNYSEKKTVHFLSQGNGTEMSNHISENGNISIKVDSIDNIIEEDVDLIKMDIEGAEYDAIVGAQKMIKRCHPVLAICIYHKPDDYFNLLKLINSLDGSYKFYIRQYAYNDNETVLYAL